MNIPRPHVLVVVLALGGCAQQPTVAPPVEPPQRAQRIEQLTRETRTLRAEVQETRRALARLDHELGESQRELARLAAELRPVRSRAEVVSALADARVALDRVGEDAATWESSRINEGREQLSEAERHLAADRVGSALFFVLRARRIATDIREYRELVARDADMKYVRVDQANVRTEPSMDGAIVTVLGRATPIRSLGRDDGWMRILAPDGQYGWIYGNLVGSTP